MWGTKMQYGHKRVWGVVVDEGTREGQVVGSNPAGYEARNFRTKNAPRLATEEAAGWPVGASPS